MAWPKPMIFSLAASLASSSRRAWASSCQGSIIAMAASLAPPCIGPHMEARPAATQANRLAPEEPAARTVVVEAHCP